MKKKYFIFIILLVISILNNQSINAQTKIEKKINPFSISCDLMSRYVWRGTDFGASPSLQPGIEYNKKGFTAGVWGAYALNRTGSQEADLYVSYTIKDIFTVLVTDYYFPDEFNDYNYFNYKSASTGHIFEISVLYKGTDNLPLSVMFAANVWGADAQRINSDGTVKGIQYSTYAELTYSFKYLEAFIGANLTKPNENIGEIGFYGSSVGIVNLGLTATKNINFTEKFSLPLSVSLISNPQSEKIYLVAGISF